nr:inositol monophosphatase [Propionibacterium sp.]
MRTDAVTDLIRDVAARLILPRFGHLRPDQVVAKAPGDLVTVADREAELELARVLAAHHPGALIVGEEAAFADPRLVADVPDAEQAWLIDPLDGTANFAGGRPDFGVMVAEVRNGEVVRGWIWQPVHRRLLVAEHGAGVECDGVSLPRLPDPQDPIRGAVPRRLRREPVPGFDLRSSSHSCAVDYPALLLGDLDLVAFRHTQAWDHAAGVLMVTELGGFAAAHPGIPWRPGVRGPVLLSASSAELWRHADAALVTERVLAGG